MRIKNEIKTKNRKCLMSSQASISQASPSIMPEVLSNRLTGCAKSSCSTMSLPKSLLGFSDCCVEAIIKSKPSHIKHQSLPKRHVLS
jgi:hypothetical protein